MNPFQKTHFGKGLKSKRRLLHAVPTKIHWHLGSYNPFCFPQTDLFMKGWWSLSFTPWLHQFKSKKEPGWGLCWAQHLPMQRVMNIIWAEISVDLGISAFLIPLHLQQVLGRCLRTELFYVQFSFKKLENHPNQIPTQRSQKCFWMATLSTQEWGNAKYKLLSANISHSSLCKNYPSLSIFPSGPISSGAQQESRSLNEQRFNNFSFCHCSLLL